MPPLTVRQALFVFVHPAVLDRNVLLLRTETTVGGHLLRTSPVPGSAAARSLLSSASAGIRLPTASAELPVSAPTRGIRIPATCAILLLPATSSQGAVTVLVLFTRKLFFYGSCHPLEGGLWPWLHPFFSRPCRESGFVRCRCAFISG